MADQFSFPGHLQDVPALAGAWSTSVAEIVDQQVAQSPQFFTPLGADGSEAVKPLTWVAFPKKLARLPEAQRFVAGEDRGRQEEYCEWAAVRDDTGRLVRASFTTETLHYYSFLAEHDHDVLLAAYRSATGADVQPEELVDAQGQYDPLNHWNRSHAVHMVQGANTLSAAIILAAQSSVVRTSEDGQIITNTRDLMDCGINADEDRNSDPLIVTEVNALARRGGRISVQEPIGLYLDHLQTEGWATPDPEIDPASFWTVSRGTDGHPMHALYETPEGFDDFEIGDIKINGVSLTSPSQIAEHLFVRLTGLAGLLDIAKPMLIECGASPAPGLEGLDQTPSFPTRAS